MQIFVEILDAWPTKTTLDAMLKIFYYLKLLQLYQLNYFNHDSSCESLNHLILLLILEELNQVICFKTKDAQIRLNSTTLSLDIDYLEAPSSS